MIEIRRLRPTDDRSRFSCGNLDLDRFLTQFAGQNQFRHHIGVTYVAVENEEILGYATVAASHMEIEDIPASLRKRLPRYPLPVLRLARLAVALSAQGRGIGKALLRHVFGLAHAMAGEVGCVGVVVDAKPDAIEYYRKLGFAEISAVEGESSARPGPTLMFQPLAGIPAGE